MRRTLLRWLLWARWCGIIELANGALQPVERLFFSAVCFFGILRLRRAGVLRRRCVAPCALARSGREPVVGAVRAR